MKKQSYLQLPRELPSITRKEPRLWVKTFAVYEKLSPEKLIRQVDLRKGLNIIWAQDSESGASGHAAGKSTFCRMLRYLLGDSTYGTDEFKQAFREKFPEAYVAGEVYLDNTPWLLVRTLNTHGKRHCIKGGTLEDLFNETSPFSDYQEFIDEVSRSFVAPLASETFPGSGKTVEWRNLLHWLTRDQDARYAHMLDWRTSQLDRDIKLSAADKTNLVRMVLGLLEEDELRQQTKHKDLQAKNKFLETLIPKLEYHCSRTEKKIRTQYQLKDGDTAFQFDKLKRQQGEEVVAISERWKVANNHDGVGEVLSNQLADAKSEVQRIQREISGLQAKIKSQEIELQACRGEITVEQRKIALSKMGPVEGLCSERLEDAYRAGCPLASPPNRDELQKAKADQTKSKGETIEELIKHYQSRLAITSQPLTHAQQAEAKVSAQIVKLRRAHADTRNEVSKQAAKVTNDYNTLVQAVEDLDELGKHRSEQNKLKKKVDQSADVLKHLRTKSEQRLSRVSDYFSFVASELLHQEVNGDIKFHSEEIVPTLNYSGDMSSAALVTLRLLIFDLACLIGSQHDIEHHPGFLIHDSPREADLSNFIYQRMFTLIAGEDERAEVESVQYIIATTEAPPKDLAESPFLICPPLSSESADARFLKTII